MKLHTTNIGESCNVKLFTDFLFAPALIIILCLEFFVFIQALLSWNDNFFSVSQMRLHNVQQGLPFVWHFAMWSDLIIISPIASYLVGRFSMVWNCKNIVFSTLSGFVIAGFMSWTYTFTTIPSLHVQNHELTSAGIVHAWYMAIVLTVIIQFLFFTKNTPKKIELFVLFALILHVFVGTHMLLGILNEFENYTWYPERPLKSIAGWSIIIFVTLLFIHRSVGVLHVLHKIFVDFPAWYFVTRYKTDEEFLDFIHNICTVLSTTYFGGLIWAGFHNGENPLSLILLITIAAVYTLSRRSVREELRIAKELFTSSTMPKEFDTKYRFSIAGQVILFMLTYFFVGRFTSNILITSALFFMISCLDYNIRRQIITRMKMYFSDSRLLPLPSDSNYQSILCRRKVTSWYLFELPGLRKEALRIIGCGISLLASIAFYLHSNIDFLRIFAYAFLIGTLALNEMVMFYWRSVRTTKLGACIS